MRSDCLAAEACCMAAEYLTDFHHTDWFVWHCSELLMPNFRLFTNQFPDIQGVTFAPDLGDHFQTGRRGQFDFGFRGSGDVGFSSQKVGSAHLKLLL